jgi:hypothetical protein
MRNNPDIRPMGPVTLREFLLDDDQWQALTELLKVYQSGAAGMVALFSEDENIKEVVVIGTKKADSSVKPPVLVSRRLPRRSRSSEIAALFGKDEDQEEVTVVWIKKVDNNMKPPVPDSKPAAQRSGAVCACPRP